MGKKKKTSSYKRRGSRIKRAIARVKTAPKSIIGTMFGAAAVVIPFIRSSSGPTFIEGVGQAMKSREPVDVKNALFAFTDAMSTYWLSILGLAAAGGLVAWGGKKFAKSNTNVTNQWRMI